MSEERCETCKFWTERKTRDGRPQSGPCRRYPPQWHDEQLDVPYTEAADWCGEYRPIGAKSDVERIEEACDCVAKCVESLENLTDHRTR